MLTILVSHPAKLGIDHVLKDLEVQAREVRSAYRLSQGLYIIVTPQLTYVFPSMHITSSARTPSSPAHSMRRTGLHPVSRVRICYYVSISEHKIKVSAEIGSYS